MFRKSIFVFFLCTFAIAFMPLTPGSSCFASDPCAVQHPLDPPNKDFSGQCPNCGMGRPMWARTWITFENSNGKSEVCSFHCLADVAIKAGEEPKNVMVTLYLEPPKMIPAEIASFVVGSKAKGTMSMTSKLAFSSPEEAQKFAESCGGKVMSFGEAFAIAKEPITQENKVINQRRIKSGKIVEPVDGKDQCIVCQMYPARYAKNKCQLSTMSNQVYHFCSTHCLFNFLQDSKKYAKTEVKPVMIWVVDYPTGTWISGKTAYYVVGSKVDGPMGQEAIAFSRQSDAKDFAAKQGGKVLTLQEVTMDKIMAK
ncbi:MAG: nitrous oxide reductase accessory protein NosL [Desulfoferrobacter sp.]